MLNVDRQLIDLAHGVGSAGVGVDGLVLPMPCTVAGAA